MKSIDFKSVKLQSGYWFEKEKMNREITIHSVYEQFLQSGRIAAFDFNWRDGDPNKPHYFWDSDVAKWMEGAAYILAQSKDEVLEERLDSLIEKIRLHQGSDGYFNIYFTVVEPSMRFRNRDFHELYCAGHLIEAAIACDEIGKPELLQCMEKYVAYIIRVFTEEKSAAFATPGHEEIEIALLRLYRHTGKREYLSLAKHFIDTRGCSKLPAEEAVNNPQIQSHKPVREQDEAVGHAVRAMYLYTGMAMLAKETADTELLDTCKKLFRNITQKKMYITGGVGSTNIGEAFTNAYDLPNDTAYAETCASIAFMFFCRAMLENENDSKYADIIERCFYNGVLSGISLDGKHFFYENPLEINLNEHFENMYGSPRLPITERPEIFYCSCCPPNLNRLLSSLGGYVFGQDESILYINQYVGCSLNQDGINAVLKTDYPISGEISVCANGTEKIALRIPLWCTDFTLNKPYTIQNGYAVIENDGSEINLTLDMTPRAVYANSHVARDAYKLCIMRGPVVYCAEGVDNREELHRYALSENPEIAVIYNTPCGIPELEAKALVLPESEELYSYKTPVLRTEKLHLIPYNYFANRKETDMRVWFSAK